jgi:replication-associated recombination protein RarA
MDLFEQRRNDILAKAAPLADRMRPRTLAEFFGQDHIVGPGRLLRASFLRGLLNNRFIMPAGVP